MRRAVLALVVRASRALAQLGELVRTGAIAARRRPGRPLLCANCHEIKTRDAGDRLAHRLPLIEPASPQLCLF